MRHLRLILPLLLCTSVATRSVGQNGSIDLSFNPQDQGYGIGDGCGSARWVIMGLRICWVCPAVDTWPPEG
ncbi:MAG: hypothetical protein IPI07_05665 [Flavobacteriales bacterium]|nr:hypothetical protein [Flavobacteriales bacterium]